MNTEIWSVHPSNYKVSDRGNVIGIMGKPVGYFRGDGYRAVHGKKEHLIHILVWETFNGKVPVGYEINHMDLNKANNNLSNLELLTHKENIRHAYRVGLKDKNRGSLNPNAKLNELQVLEIRRIHSMGDVKQVRLAEFYGVSQRTISLIVRNEIWPLSPAAI